MDTAKQVLAGLLGHTWVNTYKGLKILGDQETISAKDAKRWLDSKLQELNYVTVVGSLLASVIATSISWPGVPDSPWIVMALWLTSLTMVVASVLMAFQQAVVLGVTLVESSTTSTTTTTTTTVKSDFAKESDPESSSSTANKPQGLEESYLFVNSGTTRKPSWTAILALQAPVQTLTYCIYSYCVGLAIYIIYHAFSDAKRKIAIFYMTTVLGGFLFYVSASIYVRYMLQHDRKLTGKRRDGAVS